MKQRDFVTHRQASRDNKSAGFTVSWSPNQQSSPEPMVSHNSFGKRTLDTLLWVPPPGTTGHELRLLGVSCAGREESRD